MSVRKYVCELETVYYVLDLGGIVDFAYTTIEWDSDTERLYTNGSPNNVEDPTFFSSDPPLLPAG